jgi:hypothetical protein
VALQPGTVVVFHIFALPGYGNIYYLYYYLIYIDLAPNLLNLNLSKDINLNKPDLYLPYWKMVLVLVVAIVPHDNEQ